MNNSPLRKLMLAVVGLLLLTAGVLTVLLPASLADGQRRLERKRQDLDRLAEIRRIADKQTAMRAVFDRLEASQPAPLDTILHAAVPGLRFDLSDLGQGSAADGWRWERTSLILETISDRELIRLVGALELQRPPWKVVALNIRGGPQTGQVSQVSLTVETLIRTKP
jgi:hypothetical protein